jgi:hypothetical protein
MTDDLELLRAYEPVVRYTEGEHFFPMAAESYVAACDLLGATTGMRAEVLVASGELTLERIAAERPEPGHERYLRFVPKPLDGVELARWNLRPDRPRFRAPGRLARVGLFARLVDAGFNASLLVRGSVPGGTAAAAAQKYEGIRRTDPRVVYHGRVIRDAGWIVLHYLFFYCMNDWRSSFYGANDHEADLEQAFVVLEERRGKAPIPRWFGCAAHDYSGDDLRRRWDDPTITLDGDHPVIYAGAGSHASYFEQGEYVTRVPLPTVRGLGQALDAARTVWRDILRQTDPGDLQAAVSNALSIPFVDYARGDGLAVGPGGDVPWTPILVADETPWIDGYRGLWGLDTKDRFAGERAPAGPKYNRNTTARQSWNDPLGFLGIDKLPPPGRLPAVLRDRIGDLKAEQVKTRMEADAKAEELRRWAATGRPTATSERRSPAEAERALLLAEDELAALRARDATIDDAIEVTQQSLDRAEDGDLGDPRAHLRHDHRPEPPDTRRYGRIVEFWSAVSAGVLLIVAVGLLYVRLVPWWVALLIAIGGYVAIEAAFRQRLVQLMLRATLLLAIVGAIILAISYAPIVIVGAIVAIAALTIFDNIRELRT